MGTLSYIVKPQNVRSISYFYKSKFNYKDSSEIKCDIITKIKKSTKEVFSVNPYIAKPLSHYYQSSFDVKKIDRFIKLGNKRRKLN